MTDERTDWIQKLRPNRCLKFLNVFRAESRAGLNVDDSRLVINHSKGVRTRSVWIVDFCLARLTGAAVTGTQDVFKFTLCNGVS